MQGNANDFTQGNIARKSIKPDVSLTEIGLAAPAATIFGILINIVFFVIYNKKLKKIDAVN